MKQLITAIVFAFVTINSSHAIECRGYYYGGNQSRVSCDNPEIPAWIGPAIGALTGLAIFGVLAAVKLSSDAYQKENGTDTDSFLKGATEFNVNFNATPNIEQQDMELRFGIRW